jgi:SAM-dependent methyltransferase
MVELARARGVDARVGDAQELPFEDESFDCALAAWMLYHVPEPERAVAELARVLRPGGRLVAVTNGRKHLQELRDLLGSSPDSAFDDENGPPVLARHFSHVEERDASGWIAFPDREALESYVKATRTLWSADLPADFDGPLRVRRAPVVYVATK